MAAAAASANLQRVLFRRAPLIRFKYGSGRSLPHQSHANKIEQTTTTSFVARPSNNSTSKLPKKVPPIEFTQTPKKYRRRPLTQDEIDSINVGTPF